METPYKDWLGQEIKVGSPVLYAVSNSHYAEVVWGEVLDIIPVEPGTRVIWNDEPAWIDGKPNPLRQKIGEEDYWPYGRKFKLKVQPVYQNSDFRDDQSNSASGIRGVEFTHVWEGEYDHPDPAQRRRIVRSEVTRKPPKPVTVQNVEKVTVFPLPEGAQERLEAEIDRRIEITKQRFAERS